MLNRHIKGVFRLGIVVATVGLAGAPRRPVKPFLAFHEGENIVFAPEATGTHREARLGPWDFGERLDPADEKPRDKRLNLYVVVPGDQYRSQSHPEYNHNLVVNRYTVDGKPREWDIFWCFALDPDLKANLQGERELLLSAHNTFHLPENFQAAQLPAGAVLKEKLSVTGVDSLKRFRRKDGSYPRILIVPARLAVRAVVAREPEGPPAPPAKP
ncbi:MAG TPA: hypothetical protein VKW06_08290 [Candidatus Angelobacter sp.]|nr:hypothetical protein [Candidatus Angelobacter sp.]